MEYVTPLPAIARGVVLIERGRSEPIGSFESPGKSPADGPVGRGYYKIIRQP